MIVLFVMLAWLACFILAMLGCCFIISISDYEDESGKMVATFWALFVFFVGGCLVGQYLL